MSRIRSTDTSLEITVRKYLFNRGYRYRLNYRLPGKPDLVFPKRRIAVFVNGCFWHFHGCRLSTLPKTRTDFWADKLKRNRERDIMTAKTLRELGWTVVTLRECALEESVEDSLSSLILMLQ